LRITQRHWSIFFDRLILGADAALLGQPLWLPILGAGNHKGYPNGPNGFESLIRRGGIDDGALCDYKYGIC